VTRNFILKIEEEEEEEEEEAFPLTTPSAHLGSRSFFVQNTDNGGVPID
jgi:hypothetical protein